MKTNNRDDFPEGIKRILRDRVGGYCSNPSCVHATVGPNSNPNKTTIIGEAAHIKAAAPGGPRYDENMSAEERKSIDNGIWLCSICAAMIDKDPALYSVDLLHEWKRLAEEKAAMLLGKERDSMSKQDVELLQFYVQCFDRPAFQDEITQEGSMEDFDRAIEDTIIALNTGVQRDRHGNLIKQAQGKSSVCNQLWKKKLDDVHDLLVIMRRQLLLAKRNHSYWKSPDPESDKAFYCFDDRELLNWFNSTRAQILSILSSMCEEANLPGIDFRSRFYFYGKRGGQIYD